MSLYTSLTTTTLLFFTQLHFFQHLQYITPNLLLIAYVYAVYYHDSKIQYIYTMLLLELLSCIHIDFCGLISIILLPLTYLLQTIKKHFHITFIAPCIILISFTTCYTLACNIALPIHILWKTTLQQTLLNCILYIIIDFIKSDKKKSYFR